MTQEMKTKNEMKVERANVMLRLGYSAFAVKLFV